MFHNTINQSGNDLVKSKRDANRQQDIIYDFFKLNPDKEFTPFEILDLVYPNSITPVTSVRRAMTNLTEEKHLIQTATMKQGPYGKPNHCWKLNKFYH